MPASFEADAEGVINLAFSIKINQKKMKKLEKEYTTMKTKEKEDEIELRVSFLDSYTYLNIFINSNKISHDDYIGGWYNRATDFHSI